MKLVVFGSDHLSSSWGNGHATLWRGLLARSRQPGIASCSSSATCPTTPTNRDLLRRPGRRAGALSRAGDEVWPARAATCGRGRRRRWSPPTARTASRRLELVLGIGARPRRVLLRPRHAGDAAAAAAGETVGYYRPARAGRLRPRAQLHRRRARSTRCATRLGARARGPALRPSSTRRCTARPRRRRTTAPTSPISAPMPPTGRRRWSALLRRAARRRCRERRFVIGGAQYPQDFPWAANIFFVRHLPPAEHPAFFASSRADPERHPRGHGGHGLVPVRPAVRGRRLRRAAPVGPLGGARRFFAPGSEILLAARARTMRWPRSTCSDAELRRHRRERARERTLAEHTSDRRARGAAQAHRGRGVAGRRADMAEALTMWGIVPAAGRGSRIQPLAFSKELLPVGSRARRRHASARCAVSEYLVERMMPRRRRQDLLRDLAGQVRHPRILRRRLSAARRSPMSSSRSRAGLCDAIFRAAAADPRRRERAGRPARHDLVPGGRARRPAGRRALLPALPGRAAASSSTPW